MKKIDFIEYESLSFSKLFLDYVNNENYISHKFRNTAFLHNEEFLKRVATNPNRAELANIIEKSFCGIELSEPQKRNLDLIKKENTLAVVTGQQIGFLGGPLYTFLKIQSAISFAQNIAKQSEKYNYIPIFWVEDNDHDKIEAAKATIYDFNANIKKYQAKFEDNRAIVSSQYFDESIIQDIQSVVDDLQNFRYKDEAIYILQKFYKVGTNWTTAFVGFLNHFFAEDGLLFVSASKAIETGIFSKLIDIEINNFEMTYNIIKSTTDKLVENNYHQQANFSKLNLFFHQGNERINYLGEIEKHHNISDYSKYSPKALLRPIFQDFLIPSVAYIAGPGEVAYFAQITDLYKYFNVEIPIIIPRYSATIVNSKATTFIDNNAINPLYFKQDYNLIEKDWADQMIDENFKNFIQSAKLIQSTLFLDIKNQITKYDKQLSLSCSTAESKANEQIDFLEKKAITAIKRNNADILKKYAYTKNLLMPNNELQERVFSILNYVAEYSIEQFKSIIENICKMDSDKHIFYYINKE